MILARMHHLSPVLRRYVVPVRLCSRMVAPLMQDAPLGRFWPVSSRFRPPAKDNSEIPCGVASCIFSRILLRGHGLRSAARIRSRGGLPIDGACNMHSTRPAVRNPAGATLSRHAPTAPGGRLFLSRKGRAGWRGASDCGTRRANPRRGGGTGWPTFTALTLPMAARRGIPTAVCAVRASRSSRTPPRTGLTSGARQSPWVAGTARGKRGTETQA